MKIKTFPSYFRKALSALVAMGLTSGFALAAPITHFEVDFSNYPLGNVIGAGPVAGTTSGTGSNGGTWNRSGGVYDVAAETYTGGSRVLDISRTAGGQGWGELDGAMSLTGTGLIYFAMDIKKVDSTATGQVVLIDGFDLNNQGFGINIGPGSSAAMSVVTTSGGGSTGRVNSGITINLGDWYRLEFEITPDATDGEGTFDLFYSTETNNRVQLLDDQSYDLGITSVSRMYTVPTTSDGSSIRVNNLNLINDVGTFPVNPLPEGSTVAYLAVGLIGFLLLSRNRRRGVLGHPVRASH